MPTPSNAELKREAELMGASFSEAPIRPRKKNLARRFLSPVADALTDPKNKTLQNAIGIAAAYPGELARSVPSVLSASQWLAGRAAPIAQSFGDSAKAWINSETTPAPTIPMAPVNVPPRGTEARSMTAAEFNQGGLGISENTVPQSRVGGPLFESEPGGVEPVADPVVPSSREYPGLVNFSGRVGTTRAERENSAFGSNRSGSFGIEDYRPEPKGPSKAVRDPEPAHMAPLPREDRSKPSWVDFAAQKAENEMIRARNEGRIAKADADQARIEQANARDVSAQRQAFELSALQRRQALIQAFEETTGQPFSEKALAEELKRQYEAGEKEMILADIFEIFEDERRDLEKVGPGPAGDQKKALIREHYRELRDRLQNVRTNRAVQLSKQPNPPATDESIEAILSRGGS